MARAACIDRGARRVHRLTLLAQSHDLPITSDEARIIRGVLDMNSKRAVDVMTPIDKLQVTPRCAALSAKPRLTADRRRSSTTRSSTR